MCQATLIGSSSSSCNVPSLRTTADEISVKSKQDNLCIYNMNALSFLSPKKNLTLCGNRKVEGELVTSFNSSKFFLPYFPPYGFFPWPQLPPFSSLPFPPLPALPFLPPFPFRGPPSLPFRFPQFPPAPNPSAPNAPPAFNLGDPRTWIPYIPSVYPPPPPLPAFSLGDPRTWIPYVPPPSPHRTQQNQNP
ncbi:formin-2-like [Pyrus x bretschneideri]|uniref:formin-2-like n=1 Tax=Pyrus x bretschneideri TaxID=225117 RepID=UPI00202E8D6C|nr:formin-2-like [Pyrus x bretschneideri]